jgi:MFS family permease
MASTTTHRSEPSRSAARRIATARLISLTGTQAAIIALLFEVYQRTGSSTWIAATLLLAYGTEGIATPLAGSLGDRFDRRRVMIASDLLGAVCFASFALAKSPSSLLVLAFLAAVAESPTFPAASAAIPNLVDPADLAWANSTVGMGTSIGYLAGPALGGALVAVTGSTVVFLANAVSFVISAAIVASVRGRFSADREEQPEHRGVRAGFRFAGRDPVLRRMMLAFAVFAVCVGSVLVAELPLAESFHAGSTGYGLISTCFGLGALAGAIAARRVTRSTERRVLVGCSFITAAGFGAVALMPLFGPILALMLVAGASDGAVDVVVEVIFQRRSPDAVRSRVIGALEAVWHSGLGVSFLFAGWLIDAYGAKSAYALAGIGCAICALILVPLVRRHLDPPLEGAGGASTPDGEVPPRMAKGSVPAPGS